MPKIADAIERVPARCYETLNMLAGLTRASAENGNDNEQLHWRNKIRGYLFCLRDIGHLTQTDVSALCLYLSQGYKLKKKKASHFLNDIDKMIDFGILAKEEFLASYSYLTEEEYDATAVAVDRRIVRLAERSIRKPLRLARS